MSTVLYSRLVATLLLHSFTSHSHPSLREAGLLIGGTDQADEKNAATAWDAINVATCEEKGHDSCACAVQCIVQKKKTSKCMVQSFGVDVRKRIIFAFALILQAQVPHPYS